MQNKSKREDRSSDSGEEDGQKKKRRAVANPSNLFCRVCGTRDTPEWRRGFCSLFRVSAFVFSFFLHYLPNVVIQSCYCFSGPDGCKSLCNACGLHYAKIV